MADGAGSTLGDPSSPVTGVAHVGLTVPDLGGAIEMWCDGLGFALERTFSLDEEVTAATTGVRSATIRAATVTLGHHRVELLEYEPVGAPAGWVSPCSPEPRTSRSRWPISTRC